MIFRLVQNYRVWSASSLWRVILGLQSNINPDIIELSTKSNVLIKTTADWQIIAVVEIAIKIDGSGQHVDKRQAQRITR